MIGAAIQSGTKRQRILLLPILCVHAAVLAWIATDHSPILAARTAPTLAVFDVAAARPPAPAPRQKIVVVRLPAKSPIVKIAYVPSPIVMTPPADTTDQTAIVEGGCDLTDVVQSALRADDGARTELAALPPSARSVANAIMLWDRAWVGAAPARNVLGHVRAVVLATVTGATADCQQQMQAGPRLISIPGPPDTVLAIGSGRWRWGDLSAEADPRAIASSDADQRRIGTATMISAP